MQSCRDCGTDFSIPPWKKVLKKVDLCPTCSSRKRQNILTYVEKLNKFGADQYLEEREEKILFFLRKELKLADEDLEEASRELENLRRLTKEANIKKYEEKLKEVGEDKYLDTEEERELEELKKSLSLTEDDVDHTLQGLIQLKRLTSLKDSDLPVLDANILLKKDEKCHYEIPASLIEEKTKTRYVGTTQGVSSKIDKKVAYQTGGFKGEKIVDTFKEVTDFGVLCLTNQKVIFVGDKKSITYPINSIVNIQKFPDAIQFQKENEVRPKYFAIYDQSYVDEIGLLVARLVQES